MNSKKQELLSWVDRDREMLIAFFQDFIRCRTPNPPGDTIAAARHVRAVLDDNKIDKLRRYADPSTGILQSLKGEGLAQGLPTSVVIDSQGCRLAAMAGPAEWASDEAKAVIKAASGS